MAKDRFKLKLKCPSCGLAGMADAEEEEGWAYLKGKTARRITHKPDGFKDVEDNKKPGGIDIVCTQCGESALS
ncbi:hypothetical protein [Paremcibacter congregatus]|uniref:Uncharacterized protein n=1 Tax=Paremcibacter congregatus TaxID=2043170 RepID=A0A2G4YR22_9PROT|nr:hypothetical protein [Paremcibacter congregatus]PHZ84765.1 hypothetical protein CRD36_10800 [Paremcibacter congregatus]QDE28957.1 hypothetical protein FIV45_17565 [Paremcibacter congregatus]